MTAEITRERITKHLPWVLLGFCAIGACVALLGTWLPGSKLPPDWRLSVSGGAATLLAVAAMVVVRLRDPLGGVIMPGILAVFGLVNLTLGPLHRQLSADDVSSPLTMPVIPSVLMLVVAMCCWRNGRSKASRWLKLPTAVAAMILGMLVLFVHAAPETTRFHTLLASQATVPGGLLIAGLAWALWMLDEDRPLAASRWEHPTDSGLWLAINQQGRITRASVHRIDYLAPRRQSLVGQQFCQFFNERTLSDTDLGKLNRACSWARCGRVPVATVITYLPGNGSPRLLDMLIRPKLRDGEIAGFHLWARDLSNS